MIHKWHQLKWSKIDLGVKPCKPVTLFAFQIHLEEAFQSPNKKGLDFFCHLGNEKCYRT